jgi:hypothetical protein
MAHKHPANKPKTKNPKSPTNPSLPPQAPPPPEDHSPRDERTGYKPDQTPIWKICLDGMTFLAIVIAGIIYWSQLQAMLSANDLTRKSIHDSQRAWIGISKIVPNSFEHGASVDSPSRFLLTVTFTLRNFGHSGAQEVRIFPELHPFDNSPDKPKICDDSKAGRYLGDMLLPEQEREVPYGVNIDVSEMEAALKKQNPAIGRNLLLVLRGCIEYVDDRTETQPHYTPFSYFVTRVPPDRFINVDQQSVPGSGIVLQPNLNNPGGID